MRAATACQHTHKVTAIQQLLLSFQLFLAIDFFFVHLNWLGKQVVATDQLHFMINVEDHVDGEYQQLITEMKGVLIFIPQIF